MAINFYGSCNGSAASKYDLWINATQNSQSIENNTSNITLKLYLKRNDGYSGSAYNLNENENSVEISVSGVKKLSKNLEIDTRNNVNCLLASWTGNVTHSSDGTLSVSIGASFSMGNTSITGGSVSGTFVCSTIPRKSTLSLSATSVNPGSAVTATITSLSSSFSHKIKWSLGSNSYTQNLNAGVLTTDFTIPVSWANALTDSYKGNISVSLVTLKGTSVVGTSSYSLSFIIPSTDEYKPSFEIGLTRIDNGVPADWDEYVQNVSGITVEAKSLQFKYGATLGAVTVSIGSAYIRGTLPATFNLTESGELTITLAVRDSRGLLTVKTAKINVLPYAPPSVNIISLERCNSSGEADTYGTYLCVRYNLSYSSLNSKNQCSLKASYKTQSDAEYSSAVGLTESPAVFGDGKISIYNSISVCFSVSDSISSKSVDIVRAVSGANIPFNIKRGGTGAAFGKFSQNDNELSLGWNLSVDGDVDFKGELKYEDVECVCSQNTQDYVGTVRYYPCFNGCFVRMRLKTGNALSAGTSHHVATVSEKVPGMFTPLSCVANFSGDGQSTAGIAYETGYVTVKSDTEIPAGSFIYISGFYIADRN